MANKRLANIQSNMANSFKNETDFSPRSPAYKPPHRNETNQLATTNNANIDIKLKLLKEQLFEEFMLIINNLVVDGGDLDA